MNRSSDRNAARFKAKQDDVFGRIASRYDLLSDLLSFGIHRLWKRKLAQTIDEKPWVTLLDGASGTGDVVLRVLALANVQDKEITVTDLSHQMLDRAKARLEASQPDHAMISYQILDAENMIEIADSSIDCFSFSLCAKICDRQAVFVEALRILTPGGRMLVLEASAIPNRYVQWLYLRYMNICMPVIGWLATGGDASAYLYLLRSIEAFPSAEDLAIEMRAAGFKDVTYVHLTFGVVALHVGAK